MANEKTLDKIVSLCKRRGFVFPSSEIYGSLAAVYDYGPYGVELKNNIAREWWKHMVHMREDVVGLDSGIFMHPTTWEASGHLDGFDDPQIDCRNCQARIRADHMLEDLGVDADKMSAEEINQTIEKMKADGKKFKCPNCSSLDLTPAKNFSLMVKSNLGSPTDQLTEENVVYLRPETCGGIYLNYKNVLDSTRVKLPFGIAQIGKAFRNEIVARQFIFRTREFEQMEMQYFLEPAQMNEKYEEWKQARWNWYLEYGIAKENIQWYKHSKLAHYASQAYDIEYKFDALGGFKEMEGIHQRGDWDLSQHSKFSGVDLRYRDPQTGEKFIPHIMETSVGLNRMFFAFLHEAYTEEVAEGEVRTVLKFDRRLAPVKVAVFPLLKNKPQLVEKAREIFRGLSSRFACEFDDNGNIGKRYRRQDEIGTPFCVTIDFDTVEKDDSVTVRERDSMEQERVRIAELDAYLSKKLA
jgi:glycyl-tRNA synthetase